MKISDKRSQKIVYMSRCIINQNLRFPGIAIKPGPISEITEELLQNNLGIELLPCLERLGWGGILRKSFFKYLPMSINCCDKWYFFIIRFFIKKWIYNFKRLCNKEVKKVIKQMEDYIDSGFEIIGILATDDSPTCGLTKTINLLTAASGIKALGYNAGDFLNPNLEKMRFIIPNLCENGRGIFMKQLIEQLDKKKINIKMIGIDPWNDLSIEAQKITNLIKEKNL
ncbi:MAG: hypothetical protein ACFFAO_11250 [Candidatus Hermodarchaeota archaeon]